MTRKPNKSVAVAGVPPVPESVVVGVALVLEELLMEVELGEDDDDMLGGLRRMPEGEYGGPCDDGG